MPCCCFGKQKHKKDSDQYLQREASSRESEQEKTGSPVVPAAPSVIGGTVAGPNELRQDDEADRANRRRDVVASFYSDECELIGFKPTGSRPVSIHVAASSVGQDAPAATSSPAPSSPASARSAASCRAELADKRREFFRQLTFDEDDGSLRQNSSRPTSRVPELRPNSPPLLYDVRNLRHVQLPKPKEEPRSTLPRVTLRSVSPMPVVSSTEASPHSTLPRVTLRSISPPLSYDEAPQLSASSLPLQWGEDEDACSLSLSTEKPIPKPRTHVPPGEVHHELNNTHVPTTMVTPLCLEEPLPPAPPTPPVAPRVSFKVPFPEDLCATPIAPINERVARRDSQDDDYVLLREQDSPSVNSQSTTSYSSSQSEHCVTFVDSSQLIEHTSTSPLLSSEPLDHTFLTTTLTTCLEPPSAAPPLLEDDGLGSEIDDALDQIELLSEEGNDNAVVSVTTSS